jgi:hypothetical protein
MGWTDPAGTAVEIALRGRTVRPFRWHFANDRAASGVAGVGVATSSTRRQSGTRRQLPKSTTTTAVKRHRHAPEPLTPLR